MMSARKACILIADDQPDLVQIVKYQLEANGYRVLTAYAGEQVLHLAQEHVPDLCLIDINMPLRNGYEVFKELRKNTKTKEISVIFWTGDDRHKNQLVDKTRALGAVDCLYKPFSTSSLMEKIHATLEKNHGS